MTEFQSLRNRESEPHAHGYESQPKTLITRNRPGKTIVTCDACEQDVQFGQALTSPVLPYSRFCSTNCRDEAEWAAENAKKT